MYIVLLGRFPDPGRQFSLSEEEKMKTPLMAQKAAVPR